MQGLARPLNITLRLALSGSKGQFTVKIDGLDSIVGFVLLKQEEDGIFKPTAYRSCTLNGARQTLASINEKRLGVVWAVLIPKSDSLSTSVIISTGRQALVWFLNLAKNSSKLDGGRLSLLELDFCWAPESVLMTKCPMPRQGGKRMDQLGSFSSKS